ncbi:MAG: polysaccharide ABC transporter ATP-binding protein [Phormidium sp.]
MSDTVIRVENLGKRYIIGHNKSQPYSALRDVIADGVKSVKSKIFREFGGKKIPTPNREEFWAIRDINFEIKSGDRVGIIGRNGAGKSTLLKILSRITEPTTGRVYINGKVASLLEVGTGFHAELTGRENIFLNGAILGMGKAEIRRKFDEIVAFAEVEKFLDTPVKFYSSGMYVRLAFAVAAHLEPEILIVDEVLAVGDAQFQKKCLGKMEDVATKEGRTVLFVSHNMGAVTTLCNQAIYLAKGRIREIGTTERTVTSYISELFDNQADDIAQLRLPGLGQEVRFTNIQLISDDGITILFGNNINFELTILSERDFKDLSIGSSIFNSSGNCVGSLITKEKFSLVAEQKMKLYLTVSNINLAPGSYYTGFSIGYGGLEETNRYDLEAIIGKPAFQIIPFSEGKESLANWNSNWGNIVIRDSKLMINKN